MPQDTDLLVADIGGTNARFAISDAAGELHELRVLHAANFPKIDEAIAAYFAELKRPRPKQACFAVACPAKGAEIKLTNSSWRFVKEELRRNFQFERFVVINDFEALAASVPVLKGAQLAELRPGTADPTSVSLVIGPGTGLRAFGSPGRARRGGLFFFLFLSQPKILENLTE